MPLNHMKAKGAHFLPRSRAEGRLIRCIAMELHRTRHTRSRREATYMEVANYRKAAWQLMECKSTPFTGWTACPKPSCPINSPNHLCTLRPFFRKETSKQPHVSSSEKSSELLRCVLSFVEANSQLAHLHPHLSPAGSLRGAHCSLLC